jgi:hypothetical protein
VLANDSDVEGDPITATVVTQPQFGTLTFSPNGTFTYLHTGSTRATDSFTYRASDGQLNSVVTTVTINVGLPLPPPHQNPIINQDVNADGTVSPIDALLVINYINSGAPSSVVSIAPPPPYRDVDGDNFISARDALLVINYLNTHLFGEGEGQTADDVAPGFIDALASVSSWEYNVSRVTDNQRIGVRAIELRAGEIYGPLAAQELGLSQVLADMQGEESNGWPIVDWPSDASADKQHKASDEALANLMAEFGSES